MQLPEYIQVYTHMYIHTYIYIIIRTGYNRESMQRKAETDARSLYTGACDSMPHSIAERMPRKDLSFGRQGSYVRIPALSCVFSFVYFLFLCIFGKYSTICVYVCGARFHFVAMKRVVLHDLRRCLGQFSVLSV
jgi:hypothetical protein